MDRRDVWRDALNRLVSATDLLPDGSSGEMREYIYDAVGNRLTPLARVVTYCRMRGVLRPIGSRTLGS